jgi:hypothetical protein
MIVEMRTYTLKPGVTPQYFKMYEEEGMAIQRPVLGRLLGYYFTEIGPLNQIIHMWAYDNLQDRADRRAKLGADPKWQAYVKKIVELIETQESRILHPAPILPDPKPLD